ncbi:carbohydrate-binding protein [Paenibacillus sp. GCM10027629]|uniref:carbohydrate-binding protein n=1 Tax=Paenibacillus sp. GCM10027629 TaxID=3273414 RepID=UPI00363463EC
MDTLAKFKKSSLSFILMFALIFSNFAGYTPVHAASDAVSDAASAPASDAYSLMEAENFSAKSGTSLKIEDSPDGGKSIGGTNDGQYLVYNNIDFGSGANGATKFSSRIAVKGSNGGGNIEVRLDSPTGTLAGTLTVAATAPDNWNVYQTQSTDITNVTGVHDIYLVLKVATGKLYVANINWFQFSKTLNSIAMTTPPTKTVYRLGESLDLTGIVVTGTYIDGSTRVEEVRASDVSGFSSSTAVASQTLTVTVRGKTATFKVGIMSKALTSIATPAAITGVINGTAPSPAALGLPGTVVMMTDGGNANTFVNWDVAASGYDTTVKTEQRFTVPGTVVLPSDIANSNNVPLSTSISVTVLAATDPSKDTSYKFSYMVFSDTHAVKQGDRQNIALDNAMQDAVRNNAGSVSVVGDITDYGTDAQYDVVMNTMNKYPDVEPNFAYGNHEVRWVGGIEVAKSRFLNKTKMPDIYFDKWINGYHFIYLGSEADDKDGAYISDTQLEWLKAKLAEGASKDKPIFLFLHQPLEDTVSQSHAYSSPFPYNSDEAQDQKVKDIVGQYPQSVLITGHLHDDMRIPGNLYNEQYFTMIRDGSIVDGAQALIFDIYADKVVINGRDVNTRSTIASWTITNYTTDALSADTQAPTTPSNVTAKVLTDTMITLSWDKAADNFNGNVGVIGYDVYNGSTLIGSTTGSTSYKVTGLTANTAYQFTVKARDAAGNVSNESSPYKVTTLDYDPAAINVVLNKPATANGNVTGFDPSKAVDGSSTSGSKWSSTTTGDKWLKVDLGQNYSIARWVVMHAGESGETISLNTKNYSIQGSIDGTDWDDLDSVEANVSNSTDRYIPISTVRYVRLYITSGQNAIENGDSNVYELEVYGGIPRTNEVPVPPVSIPVTQSMVNASTNIWPGTGTTQQNGWFAFDDDLNTSPDTTSASGWVLVDFGANNKQVIDTIKFYPRKGNISRMAGGIFQGSNDGTNFVNLYTVGSLGGGYKWYKAAVTDKTPFRYFRYYSPGGFANVAEIQLFKQSPVSPKSTLTGADQAAPGQTFDLTMGLSGVTESVYQQLYGQDLTLHYDPMSLQFNSVTSLKEGFKVIDQKEKVPGQVRIVAASVGENVYAQGDLLTFNFTAKSAAQATDTTVSVSNVIIASGEGNELQVGEVSHKLQISIPVDKSLLNAAIASAQTKYDAAVEGNGHGLYVVGSKAQLQSAIDAAKATANDPNATQQQVDSAKSALEAAIQVFESKKISADVNGKDGITVGDLAIVAAAYGKQEGQPGWNAKADVNHDGKVDIEDLAIVAKAILQ